MSRSYNILKPLIESVQPKSIDFSAGVDISGYTSQSNPYTCPSDGYIRMFCSYRSGSYAQLLDVRQFVVAQFSAPGTVNL